MDEKPLIKGWLEWAGLHPSPGLSRNFPPGVFPNFQGQLQRLEMGLEIGVDSMRLSGSLHVTPLHRNQEVTGSHMGSKMNLSPSQTSREGSLL